MAEAAAEVVGEHDFTSFAAADEEKACDHTERERDSTEPTNVRKIFASAWARESDEFIYVVNGSGFLHHMVRNLVGTFLLVGKGTLTVADLRRILLARNRSAAGPTAPAAGLCLMKVEYGDDCLNGD